MVRKETSFQETEKQTVQSEHNDVSEQNDESAVTGGIAELVCLEASKTLNDLD